MAKRPVSVRLDDDLVAAVDILALATGTDRTDLIARGLRRELLYDGAREFIYVLQDTSGAVRYVGRSREPFKRRREHVAAARAGGKSAKEAWLAEMLAAGEVPRLAIIDDAEPGEAVREAEATWIEHFRAGGCLTNGTTAGVTRSTPLQPVSFRWEPEFVAQVDAARGDVPRSTFVRRVLERELARADSNCRAVEAALSDDTQPASPAGRSAATSTRENASATGAVTARGASRPAASPRPSGEMCRTCARNGPPRTRPCAKCGYQAGR